jgi:protocatechuate 3,4-dioxygenase beta subunit
MNGLSRRDAIKALAVTAGGGMLMSPAAFAQETGAGVGRTAALLEGADVGTIVPEVTEGPYYFDPGLERIDITEGRPGIPLRVRRQVVDAACVPIEGARVDIWHCDATGLYSGYARQGDDGTTDTSGQIFMRGTQFADANGIAEFQTIYPSWYRGRTTHIHFKVFLDQTTVLTGQIFFPDALSEYIYLNVAPYSDRAGRRDTLNADDGIAHQATRASYAFLKELEEEYLAAMIIGVDPAARSAAGLGGMAGPPPGGPPPDRPPPGSPPPGGGFGREPDRSRMTPPVRDGN